MRAEEAAEQVFLIIAKVPPGDDGWVHLNDHLRAIELTKPLEIRAALKALSMTKGWADTRPDHASLQTAEVRRTSPNGDREVITPGFTLENTELWGRLTLKGIAEQAQRERSELELRILRKQVSQLDAANPAGVGMPKVFISYRRSDSHETAHRIYDHLKGELGKENVFIDVDTIKPGAPSRAVIENYLATCDAMIVLIGRKWRGQRGWFRMARIKQPGDMVRFEITTAIKRRISMVPVPIGELSMPGRRRLPKELHPMLELQYYRLHTDQYFHYDIEKVLAALRDPNVLREQLAQPEERSRRERPVSPQHEEHQGPEPSTNGRTLGVLRKPWMVVVLLGILAGLVAANWADRPWKREAVVFADATVTDSTSLGSEEQPIIIKPDTTGKNVVAERDPALSDGGSGQLLARKDAKTGLYGYTGLDGRVVIKARFEDANGFSGSYACVQENGLWGVINKNGSYVLGAQYERVLDPVGGYTVAYLPDSDWPCLVELKKRIECVTEEEFWDGWAATVAASTCPDKDLILRVLEMYPDASKRLAEMRNMEATYGELRGLRIETARRMLAKM